MPEHSTFPLVELVRAAIPDGSADHWRLRTDDFWCHVSHDDGVRRKQGWKLHLSATPLSAPMVLFRAAEVLLAQGCDFKFAKGLAQVEELTSGRYRRAQAGKFVTVYPADDEQFARIAPLLHEATLGLPGPRIPSDRPYAEHSLVHMRFGAIHGVPVLTNDGSFEARLTDPDGRPVKDERTPWFAPPAWAPPPPVPVPTAVSNGRRVVIDDRFQVDSAIRHSSRGGVYFGTDLATGAKVVLKQARPHVAAQLNGLDARDALRREARMLTELKGLAAELIVLVEHGGDLFLIESVVPGRPLTDEVDAMLRAGAEPYSLARKLIALLRAVHDRGLVFRDLSPANVMALPDGELRLIDPETAARPGELVHRTFTPGFAAPEVLNGKRFEPAPDTAVDRYALGTFLLFLATGAPPALPSDPRDPHDRLRAVVTANDSEAVRRFAPAILGLTRTDPAERWSLDRALASLDGPVSDVATAEPIGTDQLIWDGLKHIESTMDLSAKRLWPTDGFGTGTDACAVQYGAAGVLGVLNQAAKAGYDVPVGDVARWIDERRLDVPKLLPGLYFGRAGTAWALHDAGTLLDDRELRDHAVDMARQFPTRWPNPDICHGSAGHGLLALHLWKAGAGDEFLARASDIADGLLDAATRTDDGVFWPVPDDFDSELAGTWHFGFGHGVAGVGTFLLEAADATGRADLHDVAAEAGATLAKAAVEDPDGGVRWRPDYRRAERSGDLTRHWCSGSSGVGTFLHRLGRHDLAAGAAVAVKAHRWRSSPCVCHGLAGDGEFLLDLGHDVDDLVTVLRTRAVLKAGRAVLPDETQLKFVVNYATGLAGPVGFLLRVRHGGPRPWHP
ncbi:class IV lanthionine synthetase LanL [Kutzneria kofuensis]|uniref:Protein kinase domain-containing protein n=1 Tax=Kutzneria kofuensis TaxID=103725 RepID=A0A7W9KRC7_9PSEU|nr:class IV lanthionine synthetase LanL [Kutzneria kofuensis]MBB5897317.1 hypothetical protein [Kutzneria kofuensis]